MKSDTQTKPTREHRVRCTTSLPAADRDLLRRLGGGCLARGIERALDAWKLMAGARVEVIYHEPRESA